MPRLELNNLLRPTTTPERELLIENFYTRFDNGAAAHQRIINVEPIFYQGIIAGSEFLTYAATKLYLCYDVCFDGVAAPIAGYIYVNIYDEANAQNFNSIMQQVIWTGAATNQSSNNMRLQNLYFSRIVISNIIDIKFIGYRITLN